MDPKELTEVFASCRQVMTQATLCLEDVNHPEAQKIYDLALKVSDKMTLIERDAWNSVDAD